MADVIGIERRALNRRGKISEIMNYVSKFAFQSTVVESLRISTGKKRELPNDEPLFAPFNNQNDASNLKIVTDEMQAKIEKMQNDTNRMMHEQRKISADCSLNNLSKIKKMQEEMNDVALCKISAKCVDQSRSSKTKPEGDELKRFDFDLQKNRKPIFIRSRL